MPRTIAYPSRGHHTDLGLNYRINVKGIALTPKDDQASQPGAEDDYQSKLIKYIPGEALAFYAPLAPGATGKVATIAITLLGVIGTVLYLRQSARRLKEAEKPLRHYYFLSAASFLVWALSINDNFSTLLGIPAQAKILILPCTVFLLPLIDDELTSRGI